MTVDNAIQALTSRRPGEYGREHIRHSALIALLAVVTLSIGAPSLAFPLGFHSPEFLAVLLTEIVALVSIDKTLSWRLGPWERGVDGEIFVGDQLEPLTGRGWRVLHGIQTGRTDIDHLVIGPGGIATIETKSRRGHVTVAHATTRYLKQAKSHRRRLIELVPSLPEVDALLVFRGPTVQIDPARMRGVLVLDAADLPGYLDKLPIVASDDEVRTAYNEIVRCLAAK